MRHVALMLALVAGCGGDDDDSSQPPACEAPVRGTSVTFREVARTDGPALLVTSPPKDVRRFVVEQHGRIKQLTDSGLSPTPFLDISDRVACCYDKGLLGLAFHPRFASNGQFFVYYTTEAENIVARFTVDPSNPDVADAATEVRLLTIPTLPDGHRGGTIEFGNDGMLYIGTGDGARGGVGHDGGDPLNNSQNRDVLLGKMLRIDVDKKADGKEYGIPGDNPFASRGGAPEILALGFRNPWRWSFDRANGDLYVADVGEARVEELNIVPARKLSGANFGWDMFEGTQCFDPPCDPSGMWMPQLEKLHSDGWCAIIDGATYRGSCHPDLAGTHLLTDYCAAELVAVVRDGTSLTESNLAVSYIDATGTHSGMPAMPASLHADASGELYLTTQQVADSQSSGGVFELEAEP